MHISKDQAVALAQARQKLHTCRVGQGWLIAPYVDGGRFTAMHWLPDPINSSMPCSGPGCPWCHLKAIPKLHVPALVHRQYSRPEVARVRDASAGMNYLPGEWSVRIVELTANCFAAFDKPSAPDELAYMWRDDGRRNGPLNFRWTGGILRAVPPDLINLAVEDVLPAVIHSAQRTRGEVTLDKDAQSRIKHKTGYQPDLGRNSYDGDDGDAAAAPSATSPRVGPGGKGGKAGAA